jgi:hypothetical protein
MEEHIAGSVHGIKEYLKESCAFCDLTLDRELFTVEFDATMVGADPLTIVIIEHRSAATEKTLRQTTRKVQSFAWSLQANNKLGLINFILLVPKSISTDALHSLENDLSGTARVFVVSEAMKTEELEMRLSLLSQPVLARDTKIWQPTGSLEKMLPDQVFGHLIRMTRSSSSEENLKTAITSEFEAAIAEVNRALDEP